MTGQIDIMNRCIELSTCQRVLLVFGMTIVAAGCGSSPPPIAGGKTVEYWVEKLDANEVKVRIEAVKKLGNIGSKSQLAVQAFSDALFDPVPAVRKEAIFAVVRNWPASRGVMPILEDMEVDDEDAMIRKLAEEAHRNLAAKG